MANYSPVSETKYEGLNRTVVLGLSALLLLLGVAMAIAQVAILDLDFMGPGTLFTVPIFVPQMMTIGTNVLVALVGVAGIFSTFNTSRGKVKLFAGLAIFVTVTVILVLLISLAIYVLVALSDAVLQAALDEPVDKENPEMTGRDMVENSKEILKTGILQKEQQEEGEQNLQRLESWMAAVAMYKATMIIYGVQIILLITSTVMAHKAMGACCFTKRAQRA